MSVQRRRGLPVKVYRSKEIVDRRGNHVRVADMEAEPYLLKVAVIPQRSAKAEVPGQQQINVVRLITNANLADVDLYSRVEMQGFMWDVVTPPAYHHGTRQTRHWSIDVRQRPA